MSAKNASFPTKFVSVAQDVWLLYKNFVHWNISKCCITVATFFLGVALSLPFFGIMILLFFVDPISWIDIFSSSSLDQTVAIELFSQLLLHPIYVIFETILFLLGAFFFVVGTSYSVALSTHLSYSYISGKPLDYKKNYYFDRAVISQYIRVFFRALGYMALPLLIGVIGFAILYMLYLSGNISFGTISNLSWYLVIAVGLVFGYISYRIAFVYVLMFESQQWTLFLSPKELLSKSFDLTKGKVVFPFILFMFLFWLVIGPFASYGERLERWAEDKKAYLAYSTGKTPINTKEAELDYQSLQGIYGELPDQEVLSSLVWTQRKIFLYSVIGFILIEGVFQMLLVSFYLHFLRKPEDKSILGKVKKLGDNLKKMATPKKKSVAKKDTPTKKTTTKKKPAVKKTVKKAPKKTS